MTRMVTKALRRFGREEKGQMLIEVISLRSFGWSLQPLTPPGVIADALLLALAAALLAGLLPAWRSMRIQPAAALHEE